MSIGSQRPTPGRPPRRVRRASSRVAVRVGALLALLALGSGIAACDVGHSFVADNQTPDVILARIQGTTVPRASVTGFEPFSYVVVVPASTRLVIAQQPFTGDKVTGIEILSSECQPIAEFAQLELGAVFVIRAGPTAQQLDEFPQGSPTAEKTTACAL